jgi:hypothetical protein
MTDPKNLSDEKIYADLEKIARAAARIRDCQDAVVFISGGIAQPKCDPPPELVPPKVVFHDLQQLQADLANVVKGYEKLYIK